MAPTKRTRRSWTKDQIREILNRYRRSGKNRREFCDHEGISYTTFGNWLRRNPSSPVKLLKKEFVRIHFDNGGSREPVAELFFGKDRILKFYSMPDAGFVKVLLS